MLPAAAALARRPAIPVERVIEYLTTLFDEDLRANRSLSMAHATVGVVAAGVLGITAIGKGIAAARSVKTNHAVKQVDRFLSDMRIDRDVLLPLWVECMLLDRTDA